MRLFEMGAAGVILRIIFNIRALFSNLSSMAFVSNIPFKEISLSHRARPVALYTLGQLFINSRAEMNKMIRAGYIQRVGAPAQDRDGNMIKVLEISVHNRTYVVGAADIKRLIYAGGKAYVWTVRQNWGKFLDNVAGTVSLSGSKKAVNISMEDGRKYTISIVSLNSIFNGYSTYTQVAEIEHTEQTVAVKVTSGSYQTPLTAWV